MMAIDYTMGLDEYYLPGHGYMLHEEIKDIIEDARNIWPMEMHEYSGVVYDYHPLRQAVEAERVRYHASMTGMINEL